MQHECRTWQNSYLLELDELESFLASTVNEACVYWVAGKAVACYVIGDVGVSDTDVLAGACGQFHVFLSRAIPRELRYPVVVHEYYEMGSILESIEVCPDQVSFIMLRWQAHLKAIRQEAAAARQTGVKEEYCAFRTCLYDRNIARAGGANSRLGQAYVMQRDLFRRVCLQDDGESSRAKC